jgi:hypothetical protein
MYISIGEMIADIESAASKQEQIKQVQAYYKKYPEFRYFLKYAFYNNLEPAYRKIPDYKSNMVDITFSYVKLEKALQSLKFFFQGADLIKSEVKRTDRLISILEEMSWKETSIFEMLVLNKFKNKILTKKLIEDALPELGTTK